VATSQRTTIEEILAKPPIIEPGKMIDFVNAAGIIIIGITRWQNGILHSRISAREKDIEFLIATMLLIKVNESDRAKTMNKMALNRSVLPV
jgi:hypothetical protein